MSEIKKELTEDDVINNKMTWLDCFKYYNPDISESTADFILWNETCYPFDNKMTLNQIFNIFKERDNL